MLVHCEHCDCFFEIKENLIGPAGRKIECSYCHHRFVAEAATRRTEGKVPDELLLTLRLTIHHKPEVPQAELREAALRGRLPGPPSAGGDEIPTQAGGGIFRLKLTVEQRIALLRQSGWPGESLPDGPLKPLAASLEVLRVTGGVTVVTPERKLCFLGMVLSGRLAFWKGESGADKPVQVMRTGQLFGAVNLARGTPYTHRVTAMTETHLYCLSSAGLQRLQQENPTAGRLCRELLQTHNAQAHPPLW